MRVYTAGFRRILSAVILAASILMPRVFAQSPSTPSATPQDSDRQVEELKERLATKVAELKKFQASALFGTGREISVTTITVETATKKVQIDLTDELSIIQYIRGKRTVLSADDLDVGYVVTV